MTVKEFQEQIKAGIPDVLPAPKPYDPTINHAPKRKEILTEEERVLAIRNALRYFPAKHHEVLAREFAEELHKYGRIYMYRFRPDYEMYARPIEEYPHKSRQAAAIMKGHHKAENIHRVLVVPASSRVRLQAEKEGLDKVFKDFGAEWRNAGCSMCLGMNPDKLVPGERSISTSNRNFEGRQGKGSRTHLASPAVAAATAIRGTISSPADL